MRIYKYDIPMPNEDGVSEILLPMDAEPLSVGLQNDRLVLWARIAVGGRPVKTPFIVINTGMEYPHSNGRFIGTATSSTGIVWHVLTHG